MGKPIFPAAIFIGLVLFFAFFPTARAGAAVNTVPVAVTASAGTMTNEPPIAVTVSPVFKQLRIGDPGLFMVQIITRPEVGQVNIGYEPKIGSWDIAKVEQGKLIEIPNHQHVRSDRLWAVNYETGEIEFPSLVIKYTLANGINGEYHSAAFKVKLAPLPKKPGDKPGQLRGLKPQIGIIPLWLMVLSLLLLISLILAVWWFEKHKSETEAEGRPPEPPRLPEVVARERLAALKNSAYLATGELKAYYIELADILRHYLEGRYQVPALDRTTDELLRELKRGKIKRADSMAAREILENCDMVKFAKAKPSEKEANLDWQAVADLVERTTLASLMENPVKSTTEEKSEPERPV